MLILKYKFLQNPIFYKFFSLLSSHLLFVFDVLRQLALHGLTQSSQYLLIDDLVQYALTSLDIHERKSI